MSLLLNHDGDWNDEAKDMHLHSLVSLYHTFTQLRPFIKLFCMNAKRSVYIFSTSVICATGSEPLEKDRFSDLIAVYPKSTEHVALFDYCLIVNYIQPVNNQLSN